MTLTVQRGGLLGGSEGFVLARLLAGYEFWIWAMTVEKDRLPHPEGR